MPRLIPKRPPPDPEPEPDVVAWPGPAPRPVEHTRLRVKERFSYDGITFEAGMVLSGHTRSPWRSGASTQASSTF